MSVRIAHNSAVARANNAFSKIERSAQPQRSMLASGLAINSGKDGGARLSVSEGMRAEIGGLTVGTRNAENALDLLKTAEGALNEVSAILIRMRELSTESSTATLNDNNRAGLGSEFNQLKEYIDRIAKLASYNNKPLLNGFGNEANADLTTALVQNTDTGLHSLTVSGADVGTYTFVDDGADNTLTLGNGVVTQTVNFGSRMVDGAVAEGTTLALTFDRLGLELELSGDNVQGAAGSYRDGDLDGHKIVIEEGIGSFQLGSDAVPADRIDYDIPDMTVGGKFLDLGGVSVDTRDASRRALVQVDRAIEKVANVRGEIGALINRMENTIDFTTNSIENLHASESTVRDADYAQATTSLAKSQILRDMTTSVMVMARVPVNMVMSLLAS